MGIFESVLMVLLSILYGMALAYLESIVQGKENKILGEGALAVLTAACIISIEFMADAFEITKVIHWGCYLIIVTAFISTLIISKKRKS